VELESPAVETYDSQKAHQLALLSRLVYLDKAEAIEMLERFNYPTAGQFDLFPEGHHAALVFIHGDEMGIAFRGTDGREDWASNLDLALLDTEYGLVHRGFHDAVAPFWEKLTPWLKRARRDELRIWFTGHSLGGAMAVCAALWTAGLDGLDVAGLYTFGQPAVGLGATYTEKLDELLGSKYFRHVNSVDIVPDSIPYYDHGGTLYYFDIEGNLTIGEPSFGTSFGDAVRAPGESPLADIEKHDMNEYVWLLENSLDQ
jgi:hypothetical protein